MRSRILQCALGALLLSGVPATAFAQSAFTDVTAIAGIDSAHVSNASEEFSMMNFGTGAAWFDADLDGDLDLYMTRRDAGNVLWRQNTDGTFSDIAGTVGLRLSGHDGSAVAVADFNNDGYPDLFVGGHQEDHLFIGSGTGTFSDVTSSAGLAGNQGRTLGASWGDYNQDGWLDLYVVNHAPMSGSGATRADVLYLNDGDGTFTDVTSLLSSGNVDGTGFVASWTDYDNDGDPDLLVVNDCGFGIPELRRPTQLFRNDGGTSGTSWTFTEVGAALGVDHCQNGMGIGVADYDGDLDLDYAYSNIDRPLVLRNDGTSFAEVAQSIGVDHGDVQPDGYDRWTWGTNFFDANLDGRPDLYFAAGHARIIDGFTFQPNLFYEQQANGTFSEIGASAGLDDAGHGRSSITADYDQDGDLDLFLLDYNQAPHLYRNDTPGNASRSWLQVQLVGSTSNRDGIGGRVWIKAGGTWRVGETRSGSSLGGGDQSGVHFGLNAAASVDSLIVRWPSGARDTLTSLPVNQHLIIHESVIPIQLDVVLEGPYAGSSTMRTDLTALLPGGPATAVDSVTVTISDCGGAALSTAPAWLLADGTLRSIDDTADWGPKAWPAQGGCVTVAHRNHTPASTSSTLWDGVASLAPAWGTGAVLLTDSTPALAAGDADGSGAVNALDILANWLPVNGTAGYLAADANLDGVVNAKDALLMLGRMVP